MSDEPEKLYRAVMTFKKITPLYNQSRRDQRRQTLTRHLPQYQEALDRWEETIREDDATVGKTFTNVTDGYSMLSTVRAAITRKRKDYGFNYQLIDIEEQVVVLDWKPLND